MYRVKDEVTIMIKPSVSLFANAGKNRDFVQTIPPKIGSSNGSVSNMMNHARELKLIMARINNVSEQDPNWEKEVHKYFSCISAVVPFAGKTLNTSLDFNVSDPKRIDYIKKLREDSKEDLKSDRALAAFCIKELEKRSGLVDEYNILFYADTVNASDYALYLHCLGYRDVANSYADVNKSSNIRFYLFKESELQKQKQELAKLRTKANTLFSEISSNPEAVTKVYNVLNEEFILANSLAASSSFADMIIQISTTMADSPQRLVDVLEDKTYTKKGVVLDMIKHHIFEVAPHTEIIIDSEGKELGVNITSATEKFYSLPKDVRDTYLKRLDEAKQ
jgi:hypothetical protein